MSVDKDGVGCRAMTCRGIHIVCWNLPRFAPHGTHLVLMGTDLLRAVSSDDMETRRTVARSPSALTTKMTLPHHTYFVGGASETRILPDLAAYTYLFDDDSTVTEHA